MWCNIITITVFFVMNFGDALAQSFRSEEGPYQTIVTNTSSCSVGPPWFHFSMVTYTKKEQNLLKGSFNSTQEIKDAKFRLTMHYLEAKKMKVFDMKNQNCHNYIIELILNTIHVPFNKQNCKLKPGYYEFRDLNMDAILHSLMQSLWYGSARLRVSAEVRTRPLFCVDINFRSVKIEKTR